MMNKFKYLFFICSSLIINFFVCFASYYFHIPIIGSHWKFFSFTSLIAPVAGAWGGYFAVAAFVMRILYGSFHASLFYIIYHIPGIVAAFFWSIKNVWIRIISLLMLFILFLIHPVGMCAWWYSLYWLIPVFIVLFKNNKTIFYEALASTFVAHATGSVLWIYMFSYTSDQFLMLLPYVAIERLIAAFACITIYYSVMFIYQYVKKQYKFILQWLFA